MNKQEALDTRSALDLPDPGEFRPSGSLAAAVVVLSLSAGLLIGAAVQAFL